MRCLNNGVVFTTFAVVMLCFCLNAVAGATRCPKGRVLRYDRTQGRFVAKDVTGLVWRSEEMAALSPLPAVAAQPPVAVGKVTRARIVCRYSYASGNRVVLSPVDRGIEFSLTDIKSWKGRDGYFICKTLGCTFSALKTKGGNHG